MKPVYYTIVFEGSKKELHMYVEKLHYLGSYVLGLEVVDNPFKNF